jgi:adenosylhomocysteine nucleosidase
MKVLVTFALGNEFAPWRKMRHFKSIAAGELHQTYVARVDRNDVRVVLTGAGCFAVQRALAHAFDDVPDLCIASGLAGGLKPCYASGDVLIARTVGDSAGTRLTQCDQECVASAGSAGGRVVERFLHSDHVVSTAAEKAALAANGDAVDMESLYILAAARQHGVRSVAIRAVSDDFDSNLPLDFDRVFNERGAVSVPKVIGQVVRNPGRIAGLLRLANESEQAANALAQFLDAYIQRMASGPLSEIAKAEALAI